MPVRLFGIIGKAEDLANKVVEVVAPNKKGDVVSFRMSGAVARSLAEGKAVVQPSRLMRDLVRSANFAKREGEAASWLIKVGEAPEISPEDAALFAKTIVIASEADVAGAVAQIKAELKNGPFTPFPKRPRVFGEFSAEFTGSPEEVKKAFEQFGAVSEVRVTKSVCVINFASETAQQAALDKKEVTIGGIKTVITKKGRSNDRKAKGSNEAKPSKKTEEAPWLSVKVEGADPAKCTIEDLQKTFGAFKGLTRVFRVPRQPDRVFVGYDNETSVKEVLSAKGIVCGTAQVTVSPDEGRNRQKPAHQSQQKSQNGDANAAQGQAKSTPEQQIEILAVPKTLKAKDIRDVLSKFDANVRVLGQGSNDTTYVAFSSTEIRDKVAKQQQVKVGETTLSIRARDAKKRVERERKPRERKPRGPKIEVGVFAKDVTKEQEEKLRSAIKPVAGEPTALSFGKTGCLIGLASEKEVQATLGANVVIDGKKVVIEALKKATEKKD